MDTYLFTYGSLLSSESRAMTAKSDLTLTPARLEGWQRSWTARYEDHGCTYVGAQRVEGCSITGAIVPIEIDAALRRRERKYIFRQVDPGQLMLTGTGPLPTLGEAEVWVLEIEIPLPADPNHPIAQSYIDTCLVGCREIGGEALARQFLLETDVWTGHWVNDRSADALLHPASPRLSPEDHGWVDGVLGDLRLLELRDR